MEDGKPKTNANDFDAWLNELEEQEQPTCDIENPDDCEACGS